MFWSGFILISLVPVNSDVLQGTELDLSLCIWGSMEPELQRFLYFLVFYICWLSFQTQKEKRWVWGTESWRSLPVPSWGGAPPSLMGEPTGRFRFWQILFLFLLLSSNKDLAGQRQDGAGLRHLLQHGGHDGNLWGGRRNGGLWRESSSSLPRLQVLIKNIINIIWIMNIYWWYSVQYSQRQHTGNILGKVWQSHSPTDWF